MRRGLMRLIETISEEQIGQPEGDHDRWSSTIVAVDEGIDDRARDRTAVEASEAERFLLAALWVFRRELRRRADQRSGHRARIGGRSLLLSAVMRRDKDATAELCKKMLVDLPELQILYVPLSKSGQGIDIALARMRQRIIENLLVALPRLGLLADTVEVLDAARRWNAIYPRAAAP